MRGSLREELPLFQITHRPWKDLSCIKSLHISLEQFVIPFRAPNCSLHRDATVTYCGVCSWPWQWFEL